MTDPLDIGVWSRVGRWIKSPWEIENKRPSEGRGSW